jgi:hypothetical protein
MLPKEQLRTITPGQAFAPSTPLLPKVSPEKMKFVATESEVGPDGCIKLKFKKTYFGVNMGTVECMVPEQGEVQWRL